ncbi:ATP-binding protein [Streptomyces eurythermus]|uniref:ATP-binding protein n=1 Tax=Streptomyces eurythermus TaxID=42237 RepID=UPI00370261B1
MGTVSLPDTWAYALRLPRDPRAARVARMTVRAVLSGHGRPEVLGGVELLASELVTDAFRHTHGPASLRITALADGRPRVGVWGSRPGIPAPFGEPPSDRVSSPSADAECGHGLGLVPHYADAWGGWPLGDGPPERGAGKLLWFGVGGSSYDGHGPCGPVR